MNCSIKLNGQEIALKAVQITIERDGMPDDFELQDFRPRPFTVSLTTEPGVDIAKVLGLKRKLTVQWANNQLMEHWRYIASREFKYAGKTWRIYRRDWKRRKLHCIEVLDK